jgi:hypothetical protein
MTDLIAKARIWRDRPASGRYILHRLRRDHWCNRHGPVTKYHTCAETCAAGGWSCLPGCSREECGKAGVT